MVTGWQAPEYKQMGMWPGDEYFAKRYDYLSEYVEILRELWATGQSDFKGEHFQMDDCRVSPRPQADMKIICAGQSDAGLAFSAKYADYNFVFGKGLNTPTAYAEINYRLKAHTDQTGRDVQTYVLFMVIADETANPSFVAADLLSQAEHGVDSQVVFLTTSKEILEKVKQETESQLQDLPRKEIAEKALENSSFILLNSIEECIEFSNEYAPEHLILSIENPENILSEITNAGSIFLGNYTPESAGDYASGTNHTLPTNGNARAYSGVSLDSFVKKITIQKISEKGIQNLGKTIEKMAAEEGLFAHKNAVTLRLKNLENGI